MRIYKIHANVAAGTNDGIAQLDVVEDGKIVALAACGAPLGLDAANDEYRVELSFASTNTLDNNDVRQSIFEVGNGQSGVGGMGNINHSITGLDINVLGGERLFIHSFASAGVSGRVSFHIYIKDGSGGKTRARR